MNTIERNELLTALYQVTSKADLLKQFDSKLAGAKGTKANRYSHLLEQIFFILMLLFLVMESKQHIITDRLL